MWLRIAIKARVAFHPIFDNLTLSVLRENKKMLSLSLFGIPSSAIPRGSALSSRYKKMGHQDGKDIFKDVRRRKIHNFPILAFVTSFQSAFSFSSSYDPGTFRSKQIFVLNSGDIMSSCNCHKPCWSLKLERLDYHWLVLQFYQFRIDELSSFEHTGALSHR